MVSRVPPKESSKLLWVEKQNKWRHDLFTEEDQAPKSRRELVNVYGYDIREDEKAPRATRLRKYRSKIRPSGCLHSVIVSPFSSRNTGQKPRYDRERKLSDGAEEGRAKSAKGFQYRRANTEEISSEDVDTRRRGRSPEHEEKEIKSSMKESEFPPLNAKSSEKVVA